MNYWKDCLKEAFEESKIAATELQIDNVVAWVEGAYENYGLANGYDGIPNPLIAELEEQKRRVKMAEEQARKENENFRKNVARRHHVKPYQVTIGEDGDATVCI